MARKVITEITDDIDGTPAVGTVPFAFGGTSYELDLNEKNMAKIEKSFTAWTEHARIVKPERVNGRRTRSTGGSTPRSGRVPSNAATIRAWAAANNIEVNEKGRISRSVVEAFEAAQPA